MSVDGQLDHLQDWVGAVRVSQAPKKTRLVNSDKTLMLILKATNGFERLHMRHNVRLVTKCITPHYLF